MDPTLSKYINDLTRKSCDSGADLSLLNHPNLERERTDGQILQLLTDQSRLLSAIQTMQVSECKGSIPRFDSCDLGAVAACSIDGLPSYNFQDDYIDYDLKKYVASTSYSQDMLDCNKFGNQIESVQSQMLMTSMRNSMERVAILGDQNLPTGNGQPAINNLLGADDGFLKKACSCVPESQIIDAQGAGPSAELFLNMRKSLPPRYRVNLNAYQYLVSPSIADWYVQAFANRVTDTGDAILQGGSVDRLWGNSLFEVPLWPDNMIYTNTNGDDVEVTHILFTPLNNLIHIAQRRLDLQTEYVLASDKFITVGYWRQTQIIADPAACVLVKNVSPCGIAYEGCMTNNPNACFTESNNPCS